MGKHLVRVVGGTKLVCRITEIEVYIGRTDKACHAYGCTVAEMTAYQKKNFLNGPGKLCKGLCLTRAQNGLDLTGDELFVLDTGEPPVHINVGKRIGIDYAEEAADFPWRFYL